MAGSTASIALTAAEYRRLTSWVRAGTTPNASFDGHAWFWAARLVWVAAPWRAGNS